MSGSWKVTLPCTRAEAEALNGEVDALVMMEPTPAIITREPDEAEPTRWEISAYFEGEPDPPTLALLQSLVPSSSGVTPVVEQLGEEDWVTMSQQGLEPVTAGRFYVHTEMNGGAIPPGAIAFRIEASRAFGTGGHATTAHCLTMLDALKRRGHHITNAIDVGTGTGILAFATHRLWSAARVMASDIDPASIDIARDNAATNAVPLGRLPGQVTLMVASGVDHQAITARAPFDMIIANILAGPLIELSGAIASLARPGATLVIAGLLRSQIDAVSSAYRTAGFRLAETLGSGDWPALRFVKRERYGWQRPSRAKHRTSQPPGDFGTW